MNNTLDKLSCIDSTWCLFLDRDGVINKKLEADYVKTLDELELIPGSLEAIAYFSQLFKYIFIVTNQQGIGKGLMTHDDLDRIHSTILKGVKNAGGNIDGVYYAPQLAAENSPMRKPNIGMALKAQGEFEGVDFEKSVMVGDSESDMQFGEAAGMINIHIHSGESKYYTENSLAELRDTLTALSII